MGVRINYQSLCNIHILHGYYLHPDSWPDNVLSAEEQRSIVDDPVIMGNYSILNDLSIVPTPSTLRSMADYRIRFRENPLGFFLWLQAEEAGTAFIPFVPFAEPLLLTFHLKIKNPFFWNFTNIPFDNLGTNLYYFSNRVNNSGEGTLYLNNEGTYVSGRDRIAVRPSIFSIDVSGLGLNEVTFVLENEFHRSENSCKSENTGTPLGSCELDWRSLPSGLYSFAAFDDRGELIPSLTERFYLNTGEVSANTLAIIDLFYLPDTIHSGYALLDPVTHSLSKPNFVLWWQNRLAYWRYIFDKRQSVSPVSGSDVRYTDATQTRLITNQIQPLIAGYRPIRFRHVIPNTSINEEFLLPNPGVETVYPEDRDIFSEVYLGNLDISRV